MNITDLLLARFSQQKPREIGKFNASDVWGITHKYTSIEEYLNGKTNDFQNCLNMWQGISKHRQIQELFYGTEYEIEKRIEYQPPEYEWRIVGKADLIEKNNVIEIKTSTELMEKAKPWAEYQAKIYCSLFKKEIGIIVQPVIKDYQLILKEIGKVERDDLWFKKELIKLNNFHLKLKNASKEWDEKKQELYNENSELDNLKADSPSTIKI